MIDLHIHTKYSDGTYTVKEVLQEAEKLGLTFEDGWGEQEPYEGDGSDTYSAEHIWEFELL